MNKSDKVRLDTIHTGVSRNNINKGEKEIDTEKKNMRNECRGISLWAWEGLESGNEILILFGDSLSLSLSLVLFFSHSILQPDVAILA